MGRKYASVHVDHDGNRLSLASVKDTYEQLFPCRTFDRGLKGIMAAKQVLNRCVSGADRKEGRQTWA